MPYTETTPKIIKQLKGNEIPKSWNIKTQPNQTFIVLEVIPSDPLPAEDQISETFIQTILEREKKHKNSHSTKCNTKKDIDNFFVEIASDE